MYSLPAEILLEIFKYLSADDLVELTGVCKSYRDLVADSKLVKKLEIKFRKVNGVKSSLGSRQYTKLRVGFLRPKFHYEILDQIGRNLTAVTFRNSKLKIDAIRSALLLCPNITELNFDNSWLSDVPNLLKSPFPVLSNVKLSSTNSDPRVFRILRNCSVVELKLCLTSTFFDNFTDTNQFLLAQSSLVSMSMHGFYRTNFFETNALDGVKFKLKSFTLKNASFTRTDHLKRFLRSQMTSLETFRVSGIDNCDLSDILNQSTCLQSLRVSMMPLNYLEPMTSVTELDITCHKAFNVQLFQNFPCLKHLRLNGVGPEGIAEAINEHFQDLECLEIGGGSVRDMIIRLKRLKKLVLKNVVIAPSDELLMNVEEILVERCFCLDEKFQETIKTRTKRLKVLTIVDCGSIKYDRIYYKKDEIN